jgi:RNA polymerase sigma factor (sigma-70 family)
MKEKRGAASQLPDEALMERYADGDAQAFDELFRRYEPRAYAFFLRRTGSPERARDLYQELFLRIHRARDRYDRGRPFAPWLFRIAQRLWIDDQRRAHRSYEVPLGIASCGREHHSEDWMAPRGPARGAVLSERAYARLVEADGVGYLEPRRSKTAEAVRSWPRAPQNCFGSPHRSRRSR